MTMKTRRHVAGAVTAVSLAVAFLLTSCSAGGSAASEGTTPPARAAAPEDSSGEAAEVDTPALGGGRLGVMACFTNQTSGPMPVTWALKDSSEGNGDISPGGTNCGEGTFASGEDLIASIGLPGVKDPIYWWFRNPTLGYPSVVSGVNLHPTCIPKLKLSCWTKSFASMQSESITVKGTQGNYMVTILRRPDDHNASGGVDLSLIHI